MFDVCWNEMQYASVKNTFEVKILFSENPSLKKDIFVRILKAKLVGLLLFIANLARCGK